MLMRERDFMRRLLPERLSLGLRSGGGGGSSSSSSSSTLRFEAFFGFSSPAAGMRSLESRRRSASAAASPKRGSLRPLLFFRPHAIRDTPPTIFRAHANAAGFKARLRSG